MTATKKPSAFGGSRATVPEKDAAQSKPHPFTPQLARQVAAAPPTLPKDATVTAFATRLPPDMQRMVKTACAQRGIRIQDAVYEALWHWLNS
ncbi:MULTISPECIES: hypothetical protein [unclassified Rhodococcus (in: high G+C Gram-positive bacteria)]|uniref:hypothetical protein n=1 Tax=unclassified Rhodococcus (in: high G+C Gram-positive bacteria) TaxID=192944 RepID=UPI00131F71A8|nr:MULTISPECIES: hypothetical protein [unclassified Rhodococcus (in: high G+C Gram-positive bacteria)]QHE74521.1 hypothetical protein GFS60_08225 [Rhodococcus sp. WAY2]